MIKDILSKQDRSLSLKEDDPHIKNFVEDVDVPQIGPPPFSDPDMTFDLSKAEVEALFFGALGDRFTQGDITLDLSRVAEKQILLYDPACDYVRFHNFSIFVGAGGIDDWRAHPVVVEIGGEEMSLHTLTLMCAPSLELTPAGRLILSGRAVITYAQNRDWAAWVFLAIRDRIRTSINPGLPDPLFRFDVTDMLPAPVPPGLQGQAHLSVKGCFYDEANPAVLRVALKFG